MKSNLIWKLGLYLGMSAMLLAGAGCSSDDDCCPEDNTPQTPQAEIIAPADGTAYAPDADIAAFVGSIANPDGSETYRWISSMDGELGVGSEFEISVANLSAGVHRITMNVYRNGELTGTDEIVITIAGETVNSPPETYLKSTPPESFSGNHYVRFAWEGVDPEGGALTFQYKLEGPIATDGWVETAELTNEPVCIKVSGDYTFSVLAVDETRLADPTPEVYRFEAYACST